VSISTVHAVIVTGQEEKGSSNCCPNSQMQQMQAP
jgi:hypothetical protein